MGKVKRDVESQCWINIRSQTDPEPHPAAKRLGQPSHLAFRGVGTLMAVLVLELQKQVHGGLTVFGLAPEASCVHLPFDGGVPVILHSIVCPAGANRGLLSPSPTAHVPTGTSLISPELSSTPVHERPT